MEYAQRMQLALMSESIGEIWKMFAWSSWFLFKVNILIANIQKTSKFFVSLVILKSSSS